MPNSNCVNCWGQSNLTNFNLKARLFDGLILALLDSCNVSLASLTKIDTVGIRHICTVPEFFRVAQSHKLIARGFESPGLGKKVLERIEPLTVGRDAALPTFLPQKLLLSEASHLRIMKLELVIDLRETVGVEFE